MKVYELKREQLLKTDIKTAWTFFSNPKNLNEITPPDLNFEIISELKENMYNGQIIIYKIGILPGIKQSWVTEIKAVEPGKMFIDEQRFGPYKFWHHKHIFEETEKGVLAIDLIHYSLPFGFIGRLVYNLFVKSKLNEIFTYRYNTLEERFNKF